MDFPADVYFYFVSPTVHMEASRKPRRSETQAFLQISHLQMDLYLPGTISTEASCGYELNRCLLTLPLAYVARERVWPNFSEAGPAVLFAILFLKIK